MCLQRISSGLGDVIDQKSRGKKMILKKRIRYLLVVLCLLIFMSEKSFALVIISPKEGEHFKEGDTVKVVAELSPEDKGIFYVFIRALHVSGNCDDLTTHPHYECEFVTIKNSPSEIEIFARGKTFESAIEAEPVKIFVSLPSNVTLQGLKVQQGQRVLFLSSPDGENHLGYTEQIHPYARYSDGTERHVESSSKGTTYKSSDTKIATVDKEGTVTAVAPGKTSITIEHKGFSVEVKVVVKGEK